MVLSIGNDPTFKRFCDAFGLSDLPIECWAASHWRHEARPGERRARTRRPHDEHKLAKKKVHGSSNQR
jgi:hypothetical protein